MLESIKLVIYALDKSIGGEIFVPKIPSYRILDLVRAINDKKKIKYIGIRAGEKLHEEMISTTDATNTTEHGKYFIIHPSYKKNKIKNKIKNFSSENNNKFISTKEIISIIKKNIYSFETDK